MEQKQPITLVVIKSPGVLFADHRAVYPPGVQYRQPDGLPDEKKEFTTMTITTYGDDATAKQIIRQVNKVQEVSFGPEGREA